MQSIILLFPGQASQYVGMGRDFYDHSPAAKDILDRAVAIEGLAHLPQIIWEGPDELLTRTDNVQPAITIVSMMALTVLGKELGENFVPLACAGHSLGEYAAHYAAGNLTFEQTLTLVRWRGWWMNEAAQPPNPRGAMVAIMGLELNTVESIVAEVGVDELAVANLNSPGQIIISGKLESVEAAVQKAQAAGAKRCIPLNVSGAWHSPLMRGAQEKMARLISEMMVETTQIKSPPFVVANVTADIVRTGTELRQTLVQQITAPVRWMESIQKLVSLNAHQSPPLFLEVGPGKVLKGLLKNIDRNLEVLNVENLAGVEEVAKRLLSE